MNFPSYVVKFVMNQSHSAKDIAPNYNFVQLSRSYLSQMRHLARKSPISSEILFYLVEHMGRTTNAVVISQQALSEVIGVTRQTISRALRVLREDNWIDVVKIGNVNAYCVNERAFWQAKRNQRSYAIFSATVIATESEQPKNFREKAREKLTYIPVIEAEDIPITGSDELPPPDQLDMV